ncbi:transposase [Pseudomonas koreensis]|nr:MULTISPECIES: transposase [Pseudomonas]UZT92762.1 transposase [Pseudomonas koreensis]
MFSERSYIFLCCKTPASIPFRGAAQPARKVIKQARWLLLRNPGNLKSEDQQVHLQDLLAANQSLMMVYLMKAELKAL